MASDPAAWDFWVAVQPGSPRYADWLKVYGDDPDSPVRVDRVPVTTPIPERVLLPIGVRPVFFLKLDLLRPEQRERLAAHLAERFGVPREEIEQSLASGDGHEMPILDEDVSVLVLHPQKWFS